MIYFLDGISIQEIGRDDGKNWLNSHHKEPGFVKALFTETRRSPKKWMSNGECLSHAGNENWRSWTKIQIISSLKIFLMSHMWSVGSWKNA
jgi:hypothetical protein